MVYAFCSLSDLSPEQYRAVWARLSPRRQEHISRLKKAEDQQRSLACSHLALELSRQLGWQGLLDRAENGCPTLPGSGLYVSLAHSAQLVAAAVSHRPVGIDCEQVRPIRLNLTRLVCTPRELEQLLQGAPLPEGLCRDEAMLDRFFRIWTAKEAYFKKEGTGITDLKRVDTTGLHPIWKQADGYILCIME